MGTQGNATGFTSELAQASGGIVMQVLVDNTQNPMSLVDTWVGTFEINASVMHDRDGEVRNQLSPNGQNREWAYLIDLSTMEILWRAFGSFGGNLDVEDYSGVLGLVEMCLPQYLNCPTN
ncbi:MAG: hypothetical protein AAF928_00240 [Myxococcota bacterium]